jgi:anti-sigma B factor antagonist
MTMTEARRMSEPSDQGGVEVLALTGELDMVGIADVRDELLGVLRAAPPVLVVDLTEVTFVGSAALSALVDAHRAATRTSLRIVAADRRTLRPIQLTALDQVLAVYPTVAAALAGR